MYDMTTDDARIALIQAHVFFRQLVYCVSDQEHYAKALQGLFDLIPKIGDFVAETLGKDRVDVANDALDMIIDEDKAKMFFDKHCCFHKC